MNNPQLWIETRSHGQWLPVEAQLFTLADRGFAYGDGVFETIRLRQGIPLFLNRHLRRLFDGLATLGFPPTWWSTATLTERCRQVIGLNGVNEGILRIVVTRGPGPRGFEPPPAPDPTLIIQATPLPEPPPDPPHGLSASLAPWKIDPASPLCRVKHLSALDKVLAKTLARQSGADEALFETIHGHLAEATASNLFIVRGEHIFTPARHCGILPGITREVLISTSAAIGYPVVEAEISPAQLFTATEAFLTNSVIGVRPLVKVAERRLGTGEAGPITQVMAAHYERVCEQAIRGEVDD